MTIFQLDENANSKKFANECNSGGEITVYRFPRALIGEKDPKVLQLLLSKGKPIVSFDRRFVIDNIAYIPPNHPGIILIYTTDRSGILTRRKAMRIIASFKRNFPGWNSISANDKIVEISDVGVMVSEIIAGQISVIGEIDFSDGYFVQRTSNLLLRMS